MLYSGVIHPHELAMMSKVLDDYCRAHDIKSGSTACESSAAMIVALYRHGYQTADDLKDALDSSWASKH
jgi:hypothetical protein